MPDVRAWMARTLLQCGRTVLDTIFPASCLASGVLLPAQSRLHGIHDSITDYLLPAPFPNALRAGVARHFGPDELLVDRFDALWSIDAAAAAILHGIKYHGRSRLAFDCGRELGLLCIERGLGIDAIIPVPLHRARLRERGYNQSLLVARGLASIVDVPVVDILQRRRYTGTQTVLGASERRSNLSDAINVNKSPTFSFSLDGARLLLVDDVLTTGSTLNSCAWALAPYGPSHIGAATLAAA